jgi:hypothetical protein
MDYTTIFNLALSVIEGILAELKTKGAAETVQQLKNAQAAANVLRQFHGTPVTKAQLESLRG